MAKSKSFFGLRKGSTKTMTYSVLRGQQITKDRVTDIANPKTMDQTLQRIPFAQAVKFYKQATKGLFRFAYEDKRPLESDYNAFMRHNVKYASSVSLDNYRNAFVPSLGNYLISKGSMPFIGDVVEGSEIRLPLDTTTSDCTTVGEVSTEILRTYSDLSKGDIITFVAFSSELLSTYQLDGGSEPSMSIAQFVINTEDTTELSAIGLSPVDEGDAYLVYDALDASHACAGAVIISRNTPSGLKVTETYLKGNSVWNGLLTAKQTIQQAEGDAYSWGAAAKAILQGSLSD